MKFEASERKIEAVGKKVEAVEKKLQAMVKNMDDKMTRKFQALEKKMGDKFNGKFQTGSFVELLEYVSRCLGGVSRDLECPVCVETVKPPMRLNQCGQVGGDIVDNS